MYSFLRHAPHLALILALLPPGVAGLSQPQPGFPARIERYLASVVKPSPAERKRLLEGSAITKLLDADASKEVAVFGAVWINASPQHYVAVLHDIENFERGDAFKLTRMISTPPALDDFAELQLPANDVADLRKCRVGDCKLKLTGELIERIRANVHWDRPTAKADVERLFRQWAVEYVTGYRVGGNSRLAVYRDDPEPMFVAHELQSMVEAMPSLTEHLPNLGRYLLGYPKVTLLNSSDLLYWQEVQFGLKPTIRINHLTIREDASDTVVASKMLYASHYFWAAIELRVLASDPPRGSGFWFITINRSRSDGLSGFRGRLLRGRVQNEALQGSLTALTATKKKLEAAAGRGQLSAIGYQLKAVRNSQHK
jgi:hypothetical protein